MYTKRVLIVVLIVFVIGISTVQAKNDKIEGCLGKSVSEFNKHFDGKLGDGVSFFAQNIKHPENPEILKFIKIIDPKHPDGLTLEDLEINNLGQLVGAIQIGTFGSPVKIYIGIPGQNPFIIEIEHTCS